MIQERVFAIATDAPRSSPRGSRPGDAVSRQLGALIAEGYEDVAVKWSATGIAIEARCADSFIRRVLWGGCALRSEVTICNGQGVKRSFDEDGMTLVSEEIVDDSDDR